MLVQWALVSSKCFQTTFLRLVEIRYSRQCKQVSADFDQQLQDGHVVAFHNHDNLEVKAVAQPLDAVLVVNDGLRWFILPRAVELALLFNTHFKRKLL